MRIFISYRREDVEGQAGRLFQDLAATFGKDALFMDVTGIQPGLDFRRVIEQQLASCGVLLAVIGKNWLSIKNDAGTRRLDDPADFVRLETAAALRRDIRVIPVLVRGARLPSEDELPEDLKPLAYRNAVELSHARWDSDVRFLVDQLVRIVPPSRRRPGWKVGLAAVGAAAAVGYGGFELWFVKKDVPPESTGPDSKNPTIAPGVTTVVTAANSSAASSVADSPPPAKAPGSKASAGIAAKVRPDISAAPTAKDNAATDVAARERAAKDLAAKEAAQKEVVAKEAAARDALAKEALAKEAAAREAAAREEAARDAAAKDAAAKEAARRAAAARETAMKEAASKAAAAAAASEAAARLPRTFSQGRLTVRGTWMADLDLGTESQAGADFWWEQVDGTKRALVPKNGAAFYVIGAKPFDAISYADLQRLPYSPSPIDGSAAPYNRLPQGAVVAYRTSNGRLGKLVVDQYGYNLTIRWLTYTGSRD